MWKIHMKNDEGEDRSSEGRWMFPSKVPEVPTLASDVEEHLTSVIRSHVTKKNINNVKSYCKGKHGAWIEIINNEMLPAVWKLVWLICMT